MKNLMLALAIVMGLNMVSSIVNLATPSHAQEAPAPEPEKQEKGE